MAAGRIDPRTLSGAAAALLATWIGSGSTAAQGPIGAAAPAPDTRREYRLLRDEEDWSFLREPGRDHSAFDRVKFVPFEWPPESFASVGGEVRWQYERFEDETWGAEPADAGGYLLQRYMLHADVHLGRRWRLFGQLKSGIESGRTGGPRAPDADRLDLHQGYVELAVRQGPAAPPPLAIRVGRQEFQLGSGRLVSVRERPNVRQGFDAVRVIVRHGAWRVDGLVGRPVFTVPGAFDDSGDHDRALWGVYAVRRQPASTRGVDLYYLGYERSRGRFDAGTAHERRHSAGTRVWGQTGAIDYNGEAVAQWGAFGRSSIRAWTLASDTGLQLRCPGNPRLGLRADVTSGDRDPADDHLTRFNPLFPKGAYFGLIAPTGPLNHMDLHPSLTFSVRDGWSATASWLWFWRTRAADGLYTPPGVLLRSGRGTHARFVGHSPDVEITWRPDAHLSVMADLAWFSAGPFLREAPPARAITYVGAWTAYTF